MLCFALLRSLLQLRGLLRSQTQPLRTLYRLLSAAFCAAQSFRDNDFPVAEHVRTPCSKHWQYVASAVFKHTLHVARLRHHSQFPE